MIRWVSICEQPACVARIKQLYVSAFPREERAPFFMLKRRSRSSMADLYALYDEEAFVGMVHTVYYQDVVFLFYLAIAEEQRGKGYGTQVLAEVKRRFAGRRVILNIEEMAEDKAGYEQRLRRKRFYLSNGLVESHYKTREKGVVYEMLHFSRAASYEEYHALLRRYLGPVLFPLLRLAQVD